MNKIKVISDYPIQASREANKDIDENERLGWELTSLDTQVVAGQQGYNPTVVLTLVYYKEKA